jgi:hypothetical protein
MAEDKQTEETEQKIPTLPTWRVILDMMLSVEVVDDQFVRDAITHRVLANSRLCDARIFQLAHRG